MNNMRYKRLENVMLPCPEDFKLLAIEIHYKEILAYIRQERKRICRRRVNTTGR